MHREQAVGDPHGGQGNVVRQVGGVAERLAETLPVPAIAFVDGKAQGGAMQLHLVGLHHAAKHRWDGELHGQALAPEESILEIDGGVRDAHLFQTEVGGREHVQRHGAAHPDLAAQKARRLLLEHAAIAVPVDEIGHSKERARDRDHKDSYGDEELAHAPALPPAKLALSMRGRMRPRMGSRLLSGSARGRIKPSLPARRTGRIGAARTLRRSCARVSHSWA
jgi:hypothetical protein